MWVCLASPEATYKTSYSTKHTYFFVFLAFWAPMPVSRCRELALFARTLSGICLLLSSQIGDLALRGALPTLKPYSGDRIPRPLIVVGPLEISKTVQGPCHTK